MMMWLNGLENNFFIDIPYFRNIFGRLPPIIIIHQVLITGLVSKSQPALLQTYQNPCSHLLSLILPTAEIRTQGSYFPENLAINFTEIPGLKQPADIKEPCTCRAQYRLWQVLPLYNFYK